MRDAHVPTALGLEKTRRRAHFPDGRRPRMLEGIARSLKVLRAQLGRVWMRNGSVLFGALFVLFALGPSGCGSSTPSPTADDGGPSDSSTAFDSAPPAIDGSVPQDSATDSAPSSGAPKRAYVMTSYKMWVFELATPDAHTEIAPGLVGAGATYGNAGIYEPFDISPDGKRIAVFKDGTLHIAELANLANDVSVPADTWAAAPRFTDDSQKVRFIKRARVGGGRFDNVSIVEVAVAGGVETLVKPLPDAAFNTDLDRYVWKWDGTAIVGPARLEGRPDNTSKAHGLVTIDVGTGAASVHTKAYASFFTFAQSTQEPTCNGNTCVTVHDGTTGENNGSFTAESAGFLPDGRVYFTSNRDQYVKGGMTGGARKVLADGPAPGDYETLAEHTGTRPIAYTRTGSHYASFDGIGALTTIKVRTAAGNVVATLTGFNAANLPYSVRFGP